MYDRRSKQIFDKKLFFFQESEEVYLWIEIKKTEVWSY